MIDNVVDRLVKVGVPLKSARITAHYWARFCIERTRPELSDFWLSVHRNRLRLIGLDYPYPYGDMAPAVAKPELTVVRP